LREVLDEEHLLMHGLEPEDFDEPLEPADVDTWDTEAEVSCPHCGEVVTIGLDPAGGAVQQYVEDCQVCCRPWQVHLDYDDHGAAHVWVEPA
jgi:hypothetical protein